jgi:hypothetical protein
MTAGSRDFEAPSVPLRAPVGVAVRNIRSVRTSVALVVLATLPLRSSGYTVPAVGVAGIGVARRAIPSTTRRSAGATIDGTTLYGPEGQRPEQLGASPSLARFPRLLPTSPCDG